MQIQNDKQNKSMSLHQLTQKHYGLPNYPKMDQQPKFSILFLLRTATKPKYREPEYQHTKISHHKKKTELVVDCLLKLM